MWTKFVIRLVNRRLSSYGHCAGDSGGGGGGHCY